MVASVLALGCFVMSLSAQEAAPSAAVVVEFEVPPVLKASELLKPEVLQGPHHTVLEAVPTEGFANQYTVQTRWGIFTVRGNALLAKRIHEFDAIARLEKASKSEEFERSLRKAAATPLKAIGGALQDPGAAVQGIGAGAERLFTRVGEAVERKGRKSANTDGAMKSLLGVSKAKREIAAYLQVDPYTDNPVLQQRLDDMAKASFAGGFVVRAGTFALSAGAGSTVAAVAGNTSLMANVSDMVRDNDPLALSAMNRDKLIALGVSEAAAKAFVEHPNISPWQQTVLVTNLARLGRVGGIETYLRMTGTSRVAADVEFFMETAGMMATYHERVSPVQQVLDLYGLPAIHAVNNALVIPLAVDYGSWTEQTDRLALALRQYSPQVEISERHLWISGRLSERAGKELEVRGFKVTEGTHTPLYRAR